MHEVDLVLSLRFPTTQTTTAWPFYMAIAGTALLFMAPLELFLARQPEQTAYTAQQ